MCKIADIEFIFDNSSMLSLLEKRANALKKAKFKLAEEIAFKSAPVAVKTCLETLRHKQNVGLEVR